MSEPATGFVERRRGEFWPNALIGAGVAFLLGVLPGINLGATLVGGGVAAYLQGRGRGEGARIGATSGLLGAIPAILMVVLVFSVLGVGVLSTGTPESAGAAGILGSIGVVLVLFAVVFGVVLGAIGGFVGGIVAEERRRGGSVPPDRRR